MPKLPKNIAKKVESSEEWGSREPIPSGHYLASLEEIKVGEGAKGPYWTWVLNVHTDIDGDTTHAGRKLFHITSLSDKAFGGLKATFTAFGFTPDTDTDEILGTWVEAVVGMRVIASGEKAGEKANTVMQLLPAEEGSGGAKSGALADDLD